MSKKRMSLWRSVFFLSLLLQPSANAGAEELRGVRFAKLTTALECGQILAANRALPVGSVAALDSSNISVLNWNLKKGEEPGWESDLARLSANKQLIILQEAAVSMALHAQLRGTPFAVFSPGYVKDDDVTGVATFSAVAAGAHCRLAAQEPLLGTPKSTNITQYALSDSDRRLIVINIHALNFSLGLVAYRQQLAAVVEVLRDHDGPVILSGDFNTWRSARRAVVQEMIAQLGLRAVQFEVDYRKRVFGIPLDHVFVRGLTATEAVVFPVESSDHNPMTVTFSLP